MSLHDPRRTREVRRGQRGALLLLWCLTWSALALVLVLGYYPLLQTSRVVTSRSFWYDQARNLAEGGANEALWYAQMGNLGLFWGRMGLPSTDPVFPLLDLNHDGAVTLQDVLHCIGLPGDPDPGRGLLQGVAPHNWTCQQLHPAPWPTGLSEAPNPICGAKQRTNDVTAGDGSNTVIGRYTATISRMDRPQWVITSEGQVGSFTRTTRAVLKFVKPRFQYYALFGDDAVILENEVTVDGYHSAAGAYGPGNQGFLTLIGTNAAGPELFDVDITSPTANVAATALVTPNAQVNNPGRLAGGKETQLPQDLPPVAWLPYADTNKNGVIDDPGELTRFIDANGNGINDEWLDKNHNGVIDAGDQLGAIVDIWPTGAPDGIPDIWQDGNANFIVPAGQTYGCTSHMVINTLRVEGTFEMAVDTVPEPDVRCQLVIRKAPALGDGWNIAPDENLGLVVTGSGRLVKTQEAVDDGASPADYTRIFLIDCGLRSEGTGGIVRDPTAPEPRAAGTLQIFATGANAHARFAQQGHFYGEVYVQHTGGTTPDTGVLRFEPVRNTTTGFFVADADYFGSFFTTGTIHVRGDGPYRVGIHYDHALDEFYIPPGQSYLNGSSAGPTTPAIPTFSILSWTTE